MECNGLKKDVKTHKKKKKELQHNGQRRLNGIWTLWHLKTISGSVRILAFFASYITACLEMVCSISAQEKRLCERSDLHTGEHTSIHTHYTKLHLKPGEWNVYKSFSGTSLVQDLSISFLVPVPRCWMGELMNRPGRMEKREFTTRLCARSNRKPSAGVWRELVRGFLFLRKMQSSLSILLDWRSKGPSWDAGLCFLTAASQCMCYPYYKQ